MEIASEVSWYVNASGTHCLQISDPGDLNGAQR